MRIERMDEHTGATYLHLSINIYTRHSLYPRYKTVPSHPYVRVFEGGRMLASRSTTSRSVRARRQNERIARGAWRTAASQRDDWDEVVLGGVPRPRFPVAVSGAEARGRQGRFHGNERGGDRPVGKSLAATKGSRFPQKLPASGTYKNRG